MHPIGCPIETKAGQESVLCLDPSPDCYLYYIVGRYYNLGEWNEEVQYQRAQFLNLPDTYSNPIGHGGAIYPTIDVLNDSEGIHLASGLEELLW